MRSSQGRRLPRQSLCNTMSTLDKPDTNSRTWGIEISWAAGPKRGVCKVASGSGHGYVAQLCLKIARRPHRVPLLPPTAGNAITTAAGLASKNGPACMLNLAIIGGKCLLSTFL
jgi:hypothetical protein